MSAVLIVAGLAALAGGLALPWFLRWYPRHRLAKMHRQLRLEGRRPVEPVTMLEPARPPAAADETLLELLDFAGRLVEMIPHRRRRLLERHTLDRLTDTLIGSTEDRMGN